jgi:hypothetical protein
MFSRYLSACNSTLKVALSRKMLHTANPVVSNGLTNAEKYIFDTNGYIIIKNVYSADQIDQANCILDSRIDAGELHERTGHLRCSNLYGRESTALTGDGITGRFDMGGMLGWPAPHCDFFRNVLTTPKLVPILSELLGIGMHDCWIFRSSCFNLLAVILCRLPSRSFTITNCHDKRFRGAYIAWW